METLQWMIQVEEESWEGNQIIYATEIKKNTGAEIYIYLGFRI